MSANEEQWIKRIETIVNSKSDPYQRAATILAIGGSLLALIVSLVSFWILIPDRVGRLETTVKYYQELNTDLHKRIEAIDRVLEKRMDRIEAMDEKLEYRLSALEAQAKDLWYRSKTLEGRDPKQ